MPEASLNPYTLRLGLFFFVLAIVFLTESRWPARLWEIARWRRWAVHMAVSIVNTVLTRLLVAAPLVVLILMAREKGWGLASWLGLKGIGEILATLVVFDLFDYWWHRFNHTIPFLWRFHRYHHLDTHVDVTTAIRFHPGELFLSYGVKSVWILVWGPTVWAFFLFEAAITAYSMFHHANFDFPDGVEAKLRWVHMTPRLHASHHTVSLRMRNGHYSTIFLLWDRIFGTFREPDRGEMKTLGLKEGRTRYLSLGAYLKTPISLPP